MSSTIQLKTGTGSAVPSSLTQGEVAINVDNGLFYYGSGSTNTPKQLESFTNITASSALIEDENSLLKLNHTTNGQKSRIDLVEGGGTFGAYLEYDSTDFHMGSIDGGSDTNTLNIARSGVATFNKDVTIALNSKLTIDLDNDTTNAAFAIIDENTDGDIFTIRGTGAQDDATLFLSGSSQFSGSVDIGGNLNINQGGVKIFLDSGSAFEIDESDFGTSVSGRLKFSYSNGDPTLSVISRSDTATFKLVANNEAGDGTLFTENGLIQKNATNGVIVDTTDFYPNTNNTMAFGRSNRQWTDIYASGIWYGDSANNLFSIGGTQRSDGKYNGGLVYFGFADDGTGVPFTSSLRHPDLHFLGIGSNNGAQNSLHNEAPVYFKVGKSGSLSINLDQGDKGMGGDSFKFYTASAMVHVEAEPSWNMDLFRGDKTVDDTRFKVDREGNTTISGSLSIPGFTNVSASLASATAGGGTITGVTAGDGLTGGGTAGTVTLNVVGGTGITANANDIAVDATIATVVQLNASSSALQTNIDGKQATLTFGKSSGNALKSEETLTTNDILLMGSSNVKGRTYTQFRSDINVEDGADVTDTTNVTAAGALMDSEVTNLAQVKAFDSSDYATAAQGTKADTAIQPSQTSSFSTATGVEDNADVTDTTNVTSAGALMDSEVTNLAQVKAFDSSDYATSAQGTKADNAATLIQLNASSSALQTNINGKQATLTFGIANTNVLRADANVVDNDFLRVNGTSIEGRSAAQVLSDIGGQSSIGDGDLTIAFTDGLQDALDAKQATLTFGKSSGNALKSEEALTTNDVLLMGSSNVKGRTFTQFRSDINVEDGADVTDTTNVTAAGALMDSELTDLAGVKGVTISTLQVKPSEGAFANGDKTKLDGIEASADVTDTANVTSAGALMDSELTDLAAVKAINQGLTTTSDVTFDDITATTIDATSNKLAKTSATDADHQGDVVFFGGTLGMDAGKIYYYNASGNWALANATDTTKSIGLLAVALGAVSDTNGMLIKGMVTLDHDPGSVGDKLFLRTSDGRALNSAPGSTGNVARIIGYCLDASNGQIYFNPSNDFIIHA